MLMNRLGRIPLFVVLSGALLLPFGVHAQEQEKQDTPPGTQPDSGKKKRR